MKNRNRRTSAFTLTEIIVVVAILLVIAAILLPVLSQARLRAKIAADDSNLRQCAVSLNLYTDDNNGLEPSRIFLPNVPKVVRTHVPLGGYSAKEVLISPLDSKGGRLGDPSEREVKTSYFCTWYLWEDEDGVDAWAKLKELDANPIVMRSYWGDDRLRSQMLQKETYYGAVSNGKAHAVRKDTSLVTNPSRMDMILLKDESGSEIMALDKKRSLWSTATSVECPKDICDGKDPFFFRI